MGRIQRRIARRRAGRNGRRDESPKDYILVTFDGPDFAEPFMTALFPVDDSQETQLIWWRHRPIK